MGSNIEFYKKQMTKLVADGNRPDEWKQYIDKFKNKSHSADDSKKKVILGYLYYNAFKSLPTSSKCEAYAQMLVDYAWIKSNQSITEADNLLSFGRKNLKGFAIIHVASAEMALKAGKEEQAMKYLRNAHTSKAQPVYLIRHAERRILKGYTQLMYDEDRDSSSSGHESSEHELSGECSGHFPRSKVQEKELSTTHFPGMKQDTEELREGFEMFSKVGYNGTPDQSLPTIHDDEEDTDYTGAMKPPPTIDEQDENEECGNRSKHAEDPSDSLGGENVPKTPKMPTFKSSRFIEFFKTKKSGNDVTEEQDMDGVAGVIDKATQGSSSLVESVSQSAVSSQDKGLRENLNFRNTVTPSVRGKLGINETPCKLGINETPCKLSGDQQQLPASMQKMARGLSVGKLGKFSGMPRRVRVDRMANLSDGEEDGDKQPKEIVDPVQGEAESISSVKEANPVQRRILKDKEVVCVKEEPKPVDARGDQGMPVQSHAVTPQPVQQATPNPFPPMPPPQPQSRQKTIYVKGKPYIVTRLIGRGGSAKVYQVQDPETSEMKALKSVNLGGASPQVLQSYLNEIELLKKLQGCDCVIRLFDSEYDEYKRKLLVIMELGETDLANFMADKNSMRNELYHVTVCYCWGNMVMAVRAMHKEGVVHSDLKPANFILKAGNFKLIDFGIANSIQQDKTSMLKDHLTGTPSYMSPEALMVQTNSSGSDPNKPMYKVGFKSDVWSLGCILYQMVYGQTPFYNCRYKREAIINPDHAIKFPPNSDPALLDILKKCLTRDVKLRPTTEELMTHPYLTKSKPAPEPPIDDPISRLMSECANLANASPRTQQAFLTKKVSELMNSAKKSSRPPP